MFIIEKVADIVVKGFVSLGKDVVRPILQDFYKFLNNKD